MEKATTKSKNEGNWTCPTRETCCFDTLVIHTVILKELRVVTQRTRIGSFFTFLSYFGCPCLAFGGCERNVKGSQNPAVLPKRHDESLFSLQRTFQAPEDSS